MAFPHYHIKMRAHNQKDWLHYFLKLEDAAQVRANPEMASEIGELVLLNMKGLAREITGVDIKIINDATEAHRKKVIT